MTICDDLRQSILQAAIQGKLTQQLPEDGTAADLLASIKAEKAKLVKEKKIKRENPLAPISEKEIPFDIPENWRWSRIGEIFNLQAGKNITASNIFDGKSGEHPYLCYGGNGIRGFVSEFNREGHFALIGRQGALCGNINYAKGQFYATEHAVVVEHFGLTDVLWTGYFLNALNLNQYATATAQPGLSVAKIKNVLIPIPPLAEQHRIVARVNELMAKIDELEAVEKELVALKKAFPEDMKDSLLQAAMQGKLTQQLPEDGDADTVLRAIEAEKVKLVAEKKIKKQKPLEPISEDEIPFEIPENWRWVRLRSLVNVFGGLSYNKNDLTVTTDDMVTVLRGGNISDMKYEFKADDVTISRQFVKNDALYLRKNQFITPAVTSQQHLGKIARIEKDYNTTVAGGFVLNLIPYFSEDTFSKYFVYAFSTEYIKQYCRDIANKSGQAFYNLSREKLLEAVFPIPPLAEQQRIVEKLDKLLPLCDALKEDGVA